MECDFLTLNMATEGGEGGDLKLISISTFLLLCGSLGLLRLDQVRSATVLCSRTLSITVEHGPVRPETVRCGLTQSIMLIYIWVELLLDSIFWL